MSDAAKRQEWDGRYVFRIGCGCRAEWLPPWKLIHRCKKHPTGVVPVRTMHYV